MKNVLDTKKLQHAIQLLKIELNERDLLIENQKIQYREKYEDLREKLADMTYQRQVLQSKLDSQLQVGKSESLSFERWTLLRSRSIVNWHHVRRTRFVNN